MERSDFIEQIKSKEILNTNSADKIAELAVRYPYSSLVQLMAYNTKETLAKHDIDRLQLFFENPIHFKKVTKRSLPIVESLLDERDKLKQELEQLLEHETKAKQELEKLSLVAEKEVKTDSKTGIRIPQVSKKEDSIETKIETEVIAEPITKTKKESPKPEPVADNAEEIKVEKAKTEGPVVEEVKEKKIDSKETDEDVLELISELPEENPIKKERVAKKHVKGSTNEPTEEAAEQEPNNLMVMMSFTDWLQFYKAKNDNEEADRKGRDAIRSAWQKEKLAEAMDDEEDVVPDDIFEKAMKSVSFGDQLVTEPLAELYVQQGKKDQAIELYKKLSLLNPEKRTYFASKIKNLHL